jgi:pimeloyl-ACP methyl ester carboxylesterase
MAADILHTDTAVADVNGIKLMYDTFGNPADPPILLIMGLSWQMIMWDENFCLKLAARGHFVIRFDNRDVGRSTILSEAGVPDIMQLLTDMAAGKKVNVPYLLTDMAADGFGLLDHLKIESAHVVGVSMGGMIGQTMALESPQRVRSLTSIMSTTGDKTLPPPTPEALTILLTPKPIDKKGFVESFVETWRVLNGDTFAVDEKLVRGYAQKSFERGLSPDGVARQIAAVEASGSRKDALAGLSVPLQVIHGSADPLLPVACGMATAEAVPGSKLKIIEGMGHALPVDVWPEIIDAIVAHTK